MEITLLLGPAGSGKTFRCLAEVGAELKRAPDGPPLVFLAPKQATYQIERALLADPELPGFTRLQVVGFETLAEFIVEELATTRPRLLSDLGRVMVLRALLAQHHTQLRTYHASARMPGFAQQLSIVFDELQHAQLTPEQLRLAATRDRVGVELCDKLLDLARLLEAYQHWLEHNQLHDPNRLLSLATSTLRESSDRGAARASSPPANRFHLGGLWLDGFAQLTEQELEFLAALVQDSDRATLAFCMDGLADSSWDSIWHTASRTVGRCCRRLEAIPHAGITTHILRREPARSRFSQQALACLEEHWATGYLSPSDRDNERSPQPEDSAVLELWSDWPPPPPERAGTDARDQSSTTPAVKLLRCATPADEAVACAREILGCVRSGQTRFREVAVLVRSLKGYEDALCRVFSRYEIPFFIDRREPVSHHPLPELLRYALRLVAKGWAQQDWFGALKTGLLISDEAMVDALENEARARGWDGERWLQALPHPFAREGNRFVPPFVCLAERCGSPLSRQDGCPAAAVEQGISGPALATSLRQLLLDLKVAESLQRWASTPMPAPLLQRDLHAAVWATIEEWLDNLELAFESTTLAVQDWMPIVEAGLANLTGGIIPPALDQVLIGSVDRSRNPDLKMAVVLGLNETVFPAAPADPPLLHEYDREILHDTGIKLGDNEREKLGFEQYLAYIACTRARERLVLTYAERDAKDKALNPSRLIEHVKDLLPQVTEEVVPASVPLMGRDFVHWSELVVPLLQSHKNEALGRPSATVGITLAGRAVPSPPLFAPIVRRWKDFIAAQTVQQLSPEMVERLYGPELRVSVSQFEDFAACAFKFFLLRGLRAEERKEFKVDRRLRGSFQHQVLQRFHERLTAEGKRWRDITPEQAVALVRQLGRQVQEELEDGIFLSTPEWQFAAEALTEGLQRLISVLIGWAPQYEFHTRAVELGFGGEKDPLPPWRIELGAGRVLALRGRIDRVDLDKAANGESWVVVIDYKASGQKPDDVKLAHGLDLQLLAYLAALRHLPHAQDVLEGIGLHPAGGFYVGLRARERSAGGRDQVLERSPTLYQHQGRFRRDLLPRFDNTSGKKGEQFKYAIKNDGDFHKKSIDALDPVEFERLVSGTESLLRTFGHEIYQGNVRINPFRYKNQTACSRCDFANICRFDAWTQSYRRLRAATASQEQETTQTEAETI